MSGVTKNLIEQWLFNTLFISYVHSLLELVVTTFEFIAFPPIWTREMFILNQTSPSFEVKMGMGRVPGKPHVD